MFFDGTSCSKDKNDKARKLFFDATGIQKAVNCGLVIVVSAQETLYSIYEYQFLEVNLSGKLFVLNIYEKKIKFKRFQEMIRPKNGWKCKMCFVSWNKNIERM